LYRPIADFKNIQTGIKEDTVNSTRAKNKIICVKPDETLEKVMELMVSNGIHRVYIVDDLMHPIGVIPLDAVIAQF